MAAFNSHPFRTRRSSTASCGNAESLSNSRHAGAGLVTPVVIMRVPVIVL
ncbi:MAG: hypothetical protein WCL42_02405 [Chlorobiaceae bacterium]